MKLSIVIPNYNGGKIVEKNFLSVVAALTAYKKHSKEDAELIYVDDGSQDDSVPLLKKLTASLPESIAHHIIIHKENKGFSSAVNTGVTHSKGQIVILLNTDVLPEENFIMPLLKHFSDETVFAVGCMDKSVEGEKTILRGRGVGRWERGFMLHAAGSLDKSNSLWASGGSSAFCRADWMHLGGMNELYNPFYWEDIDLSYRALKAGYQIHFEKESVVLHEHEKGAIKSQNTGPHINALSYRNQIQFVWLNITSKTLLFRHFAWISYLLLRALLSGDRVFLHGFMMALQNLPKIRHYRSKMTRNFVKSDESVLLSHRT